MFERVVYLSHKHPIAGLFFKEKIIMANPSRTHITLACTECQERNYSTSKNKKTNPDRIEIKKFCSRCNKTTVHKETK